MQPYSSLGICAWEFVINQRLDKVIFNTTSITRRMPSISLCPDDGVPELTAGTVSFDYDTWSYRGIFSLLSEKAAKPAVTLIPTTEV